MAFVAPGSGGSAITGYTASCTSSDGGAAGNDTGATVADHRARVDERQDLHLHRPRDQRRRQQSRIGSIGLTTIPATTPSAPAMPTLHAWQQQLSVAFVAPANGGSAITGYTAICTSSDGGVAGGNSGATSPIVVMTPLTNGKPYTCTVHATNVRRCGPESAASTADAAGRPAPQNTVALRRSPVRRSITTC